MPPDPPRLWRAKHAIPHPLWELWPDRFFFLLPTALITVILIKVHPYPVSIGLITCISPLTAITFCQVSLNHAHGSPQNNITELKEKAQKTFS